MFDYKLFKYFIATKSSSSDFYFANLAINNEQVSCLIAKYRLSILMIYVV